MIKGQTVQLVIETVTGKDPFGADIVETEIIDIDDVLIGQPTTDDVTNSIQMYGKKIDYVLGIPKGDTHNWENATVYVFGEKFKTIGYPQTGIQENIPLRWGFNVKVERYG